MPNGSALLGFDPFFGLFFGMGLPFLELDPLFFGVGLLFLGGWSVRVWIGAFAFGLERSLLDWSVRVWIGAFAFAFAFGLERSSLDWSVRVWDWRLDWNRKRSSLEWYW